MPKIATFQSVICEVCDGIGFNCTACEGNGEVVVAVEQDVNDFYTMLESKIDDAVDSYRDNEKDGD